MAKSSNKTVVHEAREALDRFKMEAASEVGVQYHLEIIKKHNNCCLRDFNLKTDMFPSFILVLLTFLIVYS